MKSSRWCAPRISRWPRTKSGCAAARSSQGHVLSVDFGGVFERLRVQLPRESEVISAVGREHLTDVAGASHAAPPVVVEATRTNGEQAQLPLTAGQARDARHPPLPRAADPDLQFPHPQPRHGHRDAAAPVTAAAPAGAEHAGPGTRRAWNRASAKPRKPGSAVIAGGGSRDRRDRGCRRTGPAADAVHPAASGACRGAC